MIKTLDVICDRKILLGIGIGIFFTTIVMFGVNSGHKMSRGEIENEAYHYGMKYPQDIKGYK